jgi:hexosaminidase
MRQKMYKNKIFLRTATYSRLPILPAVTAAVCLCFGTCFSAAPNPQTPGIIPRPVSVRYSEGFFTITPDTLVVAKDKAAAEAKKLIDTLSPAMGYRLKLAVRSKPRERAIRFELSDKLPQIGNEGYTLDVTEKNIVIRANRPAGLFYGIQTLRQLLPVSVLSKNKVEDVTWKVSCVKITDYPRFKWRGLLVDPARHFIPKPALLKFIDAMALHKLNSLQIHLTDDQGWRIEIKKYPQLTKIGSLMDFTTMRSGGKREGAGDKRPGGFYTQDDIRRIVRYAARRYINIVPEIEMPAHTGAESSTTSPRKNAGPPTRGLSHHARRPLSLCRMC